MSRRAALNFTRAPASRHTRAKTRSVGPARFLTRPNHMHTTWCRPNVSNGSWHPLHITSVTGTKPKRSEQELYTLLWLGVGERNTTIATGVRTQVGLTRAWTVGQHRVLPEGRSPILPTVWPLAWFTSLCSRRATPLVQLGPRRSPPEAFVIKLVCCNAQFSEASIL